MSDVPDGGFVVNEYMDVSNDPTTVRQIIQLLLGRAEIVRLKHQGDQATLLRAEHDVIMTPTSTEGVRIEVNTRLLPVRPDEGYIDNTGHAVKIKQLRVTQA